MATRLTDSMRRVIVQRATTHRFAEDLRKIAEKKRQLGLAIYNFTYSRELQDKMAAMPEGVMPISDRVHFHFEGSNGWSRSMDLPNPMPVAQSAAHGNKAFGFVKILPTSLAKRYETLKTSEDALTTESAAASRKLAGTLKTFSTVQRLLKEWPELEPFLPPEMTTPSVKLPVPQVSELNRLFKLPVKQSATNNGETRKAA